MNNKNLNPLNDPEVAKMLTMSPEDQLWSFLDDCVPHDGKDAVLVMMGDFDIKWFEFLLCDKFVILKLVIVICLRRIIVEKERKI